MGVTEAMSHQDKPLRELAEIMALPGKWRERDHDAGCKGCVRDECAKELEQALPALEKLVAEARLEEALFWLGPAGLEKLVAEARLEEALFWLGPAGTIDRMKRLADLRRAAGSTGSGT